MKKIIQCRIRFLRTWISGIPSVSLSAVPLGAISSSSFVLGRLSEDFGVWVSSASAAPSDGVRASKGEAGCDGSTTSTSGVVSGVL